MKKLVVASLFAFSLLAVADQQASAWLNSKFGIGLVWDYQSGGNQILWGAWRNGQPPGPEAFGQGPLGVGRFGAGQPNYGYGGQPSYGFGGQPMQQPFAAPAPMPQGFAPQQQGFFDAPAFEPFAQQQQYAAPYASPYQFANYPRSSYYYHPSTQYYYYGR